MSLFDTKLPTYLSKAGQWLEDLGDNGYRLLKSVLIEAPAKASASITLSATGQQELKPTSTLEKFFLGEGKVESIGTRIKEAPKRLEEATGLSQKYSKVLAPVGVLGLTALDLTPFGGGKKTLAKELLAAKTDDAAALVLRKAKVSEDLIKQYASVFAKTTKADEVERGLASLTDVLSKTKAPLPSPGGLLPKTGVKTTPLAGEGIERGFLTSVRTAYPEMKVAGQYIPRATDALATKAKNFVLSNIDEAERIARNATDDDAVAIGAELIKHYGDEAAKTVSAATRNALYDRAAETANIMARNLTEQGRSIQAASILGRLTPEGQIKFAAKEIQKYNEAIDTARGGIGGLRKKVPELTGQQADYILTEMKAIGNLAGEAKAIRFQKLQNFIADLVPSSLYKKIVSVWKAGLLTGVKTSGLNIFSNTSHALSEKVKDIPAAMVDSVASLFTGERTLTATLRGRGGVKEGFEKGWRYLKTGYDERNIGTKLDYHRVNFGKNRVAKGIQKYEETVFRLIGSEDQPFYYGAKASSLYNQALAAAKNAGLKGVEKANFVDNLVQNPTDKMLRYAVLDAETAVFQNETVLGKIARQIQKAPGGEIVVPFGKTPSAVATQILNYSPIGIIKTIVQNIGKGRFDQRLFSQGIGRGLVGTGALYIGGELFKKGLVALDRPAGEREQKLWELEGKKPNSIKIGDSWRSVQVLGPAGNLLLVGAHFADEFSKSGSPTEALGRAVGGSAKSFSEQTFLTGINQTVAAITDPQRSAEGYFGSMLASTIPTIVSDVARATDPLERRTQTIGERFQARIPGARQGLEPQVDVLGKEKERVGSFLEVMADPTRPSPTGVDSLVILELRRLWEQGFEVSPTLLGDKNGFEILTPEQNTDLWKRAGEITEEKLASLIQKEGYWKLNDDLKAKVVEDVIDKSKLFARVEKILELTTGMEGQALLDRLGELKASGLMTREVFNEFQRLR